jgi:transposase
MLISSQNELTDMARFFLEPQNATHRQYEALRAFFVEGLSSQEAARRFGYTEGSFRVLVHSFRQNPHRPFFLPPRKGPQEAPKKDRVRDQVIALRKDNLSIYDIARVLETKGHKVSPVSISHILKDEGFARLPRRGDEERLPGVKPMAGVPADVRALDLSPRSVHTKFGGIFLFIPFLAAIPFDQMLSEAGFPGSKMIPAGCAIRSLLALKLFGSARHSHVMSYVLDDGLALFSGLNVDPQSCPTLMRLWFDAMGTLGLERGSSFDLDFHTIPFHGEDALVEKHYVSKRSRRQKGILAFVARDASAQVFCYGNANVRKEDQNDEILNFAEFWKQRTGHLPQELIFDSKLTTHRNLDRLNRLGIDFITLRRRSRKMLQEAHKEPLSAWRRIELDGVSRIYRTPRILDRKVTLDHYKGPIRQLVIADLGHEAPTFLLTNQMTRSAPKLIERYAQRMIIENSIADGIDFFHMDALSSAVAMKVNLDLQLTLMASSLYRLLGARIGNGYRKAKSRHLFRDFIDATATLTIDESNICVSFQKRAHNPLLIASGLDKLEVRIPWLGNKRLQILLG